MAVVYVCKKCGQLNLLGCVNKYQEHFCDKECYMKYCELKGYTPDIESLQFVE